MIFRKPIACIHGVWPHQCANRGLAILWVACVVGCTTVPQEAPRHEFIELKWSPGSGAFVEEVLLTPAGGYYRRRLTDRHGDATEYNRILRGCRERPDEGWICQHVLNRLNAYIPLPDDGRLYQLARRALRDSRVMEGPRVVSDENPMVEDGCWLNVMDLEDGLIREKHFVNTTNPELRSFLNLLMERSARLREILRDLPRELGDRRL